MATQKETVDEHSGLIRQHDRELATLVERVDGVRDDIARIERQMRELADRVRSIEGESAASSRDVARLDKRLDEITTRRFETGKLIVAAVIGGLITLVANVSLRYLERTYFPNSPSVIPPRGR